MYTGYSYVCRLYNTVYYGVATYWLQITRMHNFDTAW